MQIESNTNKLRIAMLGHKHIPSREGGVEVVVEELATRMVCNGHQVTCYNRKGHHIAGKAFDDSNLQKQDRYKGVVLKRVFTIQRRGFAAISSSVLGSIAVAFGAYDVVHFHAEGSCAMLWLPKLLGKRCVVTVHGLDHQRAKWGKLAKAYIKLGEKVAVQFADEIIVLSKNMQQYFSATYQRETVFIPNGVQASQPHPAVQITQRFGLYKDEYILYLGRIVPEKGLDYLITAFQQMHTNKKLVVAGSASDTDEFYQKIQQLATGDERIVFTGFVQGQVLAELYSNAYVYVLPSDLEGMPLTLLEAMSYGNCCLVSDIPECTEVVEDKAAVFARGNVPHLTQTLQQLCDDTALVQHYRAHAATHIYNKYNWGDILTQTIQLYHAQGNATGAPVQTAEVTV